MSQIPLNLQTLYADLVQDLHGRTSRAASVYIRKLRGIEFLYAKRRVGLIRRDIFIGRADDANSIAQAKLFADEMARAENRRQTIMALKASKVPIALPELGRVLDALDDAGVLNKTVIIGTSAYQCYPALLGSRLPSASLISQDADLATSQNH